MAGQTEGRLESGWSRVLAHKGHDRHGPPCPLTAPYGQTHCTHWRQLQPRFRLANRQRGNCAAKIVP